MELRLFDRWSTEGISIKDPGLKGYIDLSARIVPKTGARYAGRRFHKSRIFIVERLINKLFVPGHKGKKHNKSSGSCTGKSMTAQRIVQQAFAEIERRTKKNPVAVFVAAVENSAPKEEIITIEYGGARYPKAVDCAPQRRIDIALRNITFGMYSKCFNSRKSAAAALADEIINAYEFNAVSFAVSKAYELSRHADASR